MVMLPKINFPIWDNFFFYLCSSQLFYQNYIDEIHIIKIISTLTFNSDVPISPKVHHFGFIPIYFQT